MRKHAGLLVLAFCLCSALQAQTTLTVTNLNDSGVGSLREAIATASTTVQDTIVFQNGLSGTIFLTAPLAFSKPIKIDGTAGAPGITISGNSYCGCFEITFNPPPVQPVPIEMSDLRLSNGQAGHGGGIVVEGAGLPVTLLTLTNMIFESCNANARGGALSAAVQTATLTNCMFLDSFAAHSGGAVSLSDATATFTDCTFTNNSSDWAGGAVELDRCIPHFENCTFSANFTNGSFGGGAVFLDSGPATFSGCVFDGNSSPNEGGAIKTFVGGIAPISILNCSFTNNFATDAGGAIETSATLHISGSSFIGNSTSLTYVLWTNGGGALYSHGPTTVDGCTFSNNTSGADGGAVVIRGNPRLVKNTTFEANSAGGSGGALSFWLWAQSGEGAEGCTFVGNTATGIGGGAAVVYGVGYFTNCTFSANLASGSGRGGALLNHALGQYSLSSDTFITNCTFADNVSVAPSNGVSICLHADATTVQCACTWRNTIIHGTGTTNVAAVGPGTLILISGDNNICSDNSANLTGANDMPNTSPLLAPLANNGGPTQTHALLAGSPARDKGRAISGVTADQRGVLRPFDDPTIANAANGDGSDIGAIELSALSAPTITSSSAPTTAFVGVPYSHVISATGTPPPTLSIQGLPTWLTFNAATSVLLGTPSLGDIGTSGPITLIAANGISPDATEVFTITVSSSRPGGSGNSQGAREAAQSACSTGTKVGSGVPAMLGLIVFGALCRARRRFE